MRIVRRGRSAHKGEDLHNEPLRSRRWRLLERWVLQRVSSSFRTDIAYCCFSQAVFTGLKKQGNTHYSAPTVLEMVDYFVCFNR